MHSGSSIVSSSPNAAALKELETSIDETLSLGSDLDSNSFNHITNSFEIKDIRDCRDLGFKDFPQDLQITGYSFGFFLLYRCTSLAKIFLTPHADYQGSLDFFKSVELNLSSVKMHLGIKNVQNLILSFLENIFTPVAETSEKHNLTGGLKLDDNFAQFWKNLCRLQDESNFKLLGVADFDVHTLENMKTVGLRLPQIVQLRAPSCDNLPQPMIEFAKSNEITLLAHNDSDPIISKGYLSSLGLSQSFVNSVPDLLNSQSKNVEISLQSVTKYSVEIKDRSIIRAKGFIANLDVKF
ncbi:Glutamate-cysteine ligase regulatory subunit [Smittium mucronatum]|uniref:GCS light chain n=1 Tax=Smittium mucronatum TaxID=133383 RepID=A0A1R0H0Y2_9FUNG|nr:Glutamate-cysteine ligase regulatory subunit [Smittium mucronatum]